MHTTYIGELDCQPSFNANLEGPGRLNTCINSPHQSARFGYHQNVITDLCMSAGASLLYTKYQLFSMPIVLS